MAALLTRETGHKRDYDDPPYEGYDVDEDLWFPVAAEDGRLHPKTLITGVELDGLVYSAYPDEDVVAHGPVNDTLGVTPLLVVADQSAGAAIRVFERRLDERELTFRLSDDGSVLVDAETGSRWSFAGRALEGELAGTRLREITPIRGFWFAWFAFHQGTALWQPQP